MRATERVLMAVALTVLVSVLLLGMMPSGSAIPATHLLRFDAWTWRDFKFESQH